MDRTLKPSALSLHAIVVTRMNDVGRHVDSGRFLNAREVLYRATSTQDPDWKASALNHMDQLFGLCLQGASLGTWREQEEEQIRTRKYGTALFTLTVSVGDSEFGSLAVFLLYLTDESDGRIQARAGMFDAERNDRLFLFPPDISSRIEHEYIELYELVDKD